MPKAIVKLKTGATITIEGSASEVSSILSTIERNAADSHTGTAAAKGRTTKKDQNRRASASDLIKDLKEEGFFEKPKGLGDMSKALEEKGFLYPLTTLSGVMLALVKQKILRRKKLEGKWVYGK